MFAGNFTNADGEICFKALTDGLPHDYTLSCESNSLAYSLLEKLIAICNIYNDGGQGIAFDDCARFFTNTTNFGPGFFAGDRCSLRYHDDIGDPDQCLVNVLSENTPTGFGTTADYAITVGISIALLSIFSAIFYKCWQVRSRNQPQDPAAADENTRLVTGGARSDEIHPPAGHPVAVNARAGEADERGSLDSSSNSHAADPVDDDEEAQLKLDR